MTRQELTYVLHDGYVHNWLALGPREIPAEAASGVPDDAVASQVSSQAVEPAEVADGVVTLDDFEGRWAYARSEEDHFLDLSDRVGVADCVETWAYAELESSARPLTFVLTASGAADVWLDGHHVHHQEPGEGLWRSETFTAPLREGLNACLVRFAGPAPHRVALRVLLPEELVGGEVVHLPTRLAPLDRRNVLERVLNAAYLEQYVYTRHERVLVKWPEAGDALEETASILMRVQDPTGTIYGEAKRTGEPGGSEVMGKNYRYPNRSMQVRMMPRHEEYYQENMRIDRTLPFWSMNNNRYTDSPDDTFQERREAALLNAARRESNLYSEIAKMAIGWWSRLRMEPITDAIDGIASGRTSYPDLLGLLGVTRLFGEEPDFPAACREALDREIVRARFEGGDAEGDALLAAACEILAGQRWPERSFAHSGQTGEWHRSHGEQRALAWMRTRGMRGFRTGISDLAFERILIALAYLIDLAASDAVWEMATVLMDKMLVLLAINTYRGMLGMPRLWTSTRSVLGGYMSATSGIGKLMWGTGIYNQDIRGFVSLAYLGEYELPVMIQRIATEEPAVGMVSRELHAPAEDEEVRTVAYKTPDFMLASIQDYHPGEPGDREHCWQATLGPGATIFTTHPASAGLHESQRPNFWRGNRVLPRVAQWQDALIALYALPDDDWMGYTHAYFPIHAFDEFDVRAGWAFARKDKGYCALTSSQAMTLLRTGNSARRELRAPGRRAVWLCQMGRSAQDGTFAAFQEKVLALPLEVDGLAVRWTTLRGETLAFDWTGPFLREGEPVPALEGRHIENPHCVAEFPASTMDVMAGGLAMRLDFEPKENS